MASSTRRYFAADFSAAAEAIYAIFDHARSTDSYYEIGTVSPFSMVSSGLLLSGDIGEISEILDDLQGVVGHDE